MRIWGAALAMVVFFSASAAEKKTDPRAFRLPKKEAPAKPAEKPAEPAPQPKPARTVKKAEPAVSPTAFELPKSNGTNGTNETDGTDVVAETHTSHQSHESHDGAPATPPPATEQVGKPAATPTQPSRFTLPGHKPAAAKKRNPASFRLPQKKD